MNLRHHGFDKSGNIRHPPAEFQGGFAPVERCLPVTHRDGTQCSQDWLNAADIFQPGQSLIVSFTHKSN